MGVRIKHIVQIVMEDDVFQNCVIVVTSASKTESLKIEIDRLTKNQQIEFTYKNENNMTTWKSSSMDYDFEIRNSKTTIKVFSSSYGPTSISVPDVADILRVSPDNVTVQMWTENTDFSL